MRQAGRRLADTDGKGQRQDKQRRGDAERIDARNKTTMEQDDEKTRRDATPPGQTKAGARGSAPAPEKELPINPTENATQSNYERMLGNLKAKYADRGFKEDDEYFGAAMEGYDQEHEYAKRMRADNEELGSLMESDPDFAEFARSVANGENIAGALRHMPADVASLDDRSLGERNAMLEAEREHREQIAGQLAEQEENLSKSEAAMREYIKSQGLSEEEGKEMMGFLADNVLEPVSRGIVTPAMLELIDKGRNYDRDIRTATEAGRVSGRNEQIVERRERLDHSLDGLPTGGRVMGGEMPETNAEVDYFKTLRGRQSAPGYSEFYGSPGV